MSEFSVLGVTMQSDVCLLSVFTCCVLTLHTLLHPHVLPHFAQMCSAISVAGISSGLYDTFAQGPNIFQRTSLFTRQRQTVTQNQAAKMTSTLSYLEDSVRISLHVAISVGVKGPQGWRCSWS